ncbi:MAG: hypothetical protein HY515_03285, partial [Candidatus Aenigmarchaeota archaeon]|nr:hypothetical protein [Candidatus Aenigmarchaeota archaeon]
LGRIGNNGTQGAVVPSFIKGARDPFLEVSEGGELDVMRHPPIRAEVRYPEGSPKRISIEAPRLSSRTEDGSDARAEVRGKQSTQSKPILDIPSTYVKLTRPMRKTEGGKDQSIAVRERLLSWLEHNDIHPQIVNVNDDEIRGNPDALIQAIRTASGRNDLDGANVPKTWLVQVTHAENDVEYFLFVLPLTAGSGFITKFFKEADFSPVIKGDLVNYVGYKRGQINPIPMGNYLEPITVVIHESVVNKNIISIRPGSDNERFLISPQELLKAIGSTGIHSIQIVNENGAALKREIRVPFFDPLHLTPLWNTEYFLKESFKALGEEMDVQVLAISSESIERSVKADLEHLSHIYEAKQLKFVFGSNLNSKEFEVITHILKKILLDPELHEEGQAPDPNKAPLEQTHMRNYFQEVSNALKLQFRAEVRSKDYLTEELERPWPVDPKSIGYFEIAKYVLRNFSREHAVVVFSGAVTLISLVTVLLKRPLPLRSVASLIVFAPLFTFLFFAILKETRVKIAFEKARALIRTEVERLEKQYDDLYQEIERFLKANEGGEWFQNQAPFREKILAYIAQLQAIDSIMPGYRDSLRSYNVPYVLDPLYSRLNNFSSEIGVVSVHLQSMLLMLAELTNRRMELERFIDQTRKEVEETSRETYIPDSELKAKAERLLSRLDELALDLQSKIEAPENIDLDRHKWLHRLGKISDRLDEIKQDLSFAMGENLWNDLRKLMEEDFQLSLDFQQDLTVSAIRRLGHSLVREAQRKYRQRHVDFPRSNRAEVREKAMRSAEFGVQSGKPFHIPNRAELRSEDEIKKQLLLENQKSL